MADIHSKYMQLRILSAVYSNSLNRVLCLMLGSTIAGIIATTYVILNPVAVPILLLGAIGLADVVIFIQARFFLGITTDSYILSLKLIQRLRNCMRRKSVYHKQFWNGMRPITVPIGHFFELKSKRLQLFILGEVVVRLLIELLIAN